MTEKNLKDENFANKKNQDKFLYEKKIKLLAKLGLSENFFFFFSILNIFFYIISFIRSKLFG